MRKKLVGGVLAALALAMLASPVLAGRCDGGRSGSRIIAN
jgi:hypothetical protein